MNSSKRQKTPWTKFRKKHGPKKKENGEYFFDESRQELENKAYPSEFMAAIMFFGSRSVHWMFGSLEVATTFLLFRCFFCCFSRSFSRRFPANSMGYFCCRRSWGPKVAFHWSAACPG